MSLASLPTVGNPCINVRFAETDTARAKLHRAWEASGLTPAPKGCETNVQECGYLFAPQNHGFHTNSFVLREFVLFQEASGLSRGVIFMITTLPSVLQYLIRVFEPARVVLSLACCRALPACLWQGYWHLARLKIPLPPPLWLPDRLPFLFFLL